MTPHPAWTEIRVLAPEGWVELVAETLSVGPCTSVVFGVPTPGSDQPPAGWDCVRTFVPEGEDTPALRAALEAELARLGERTGAPELAGLRAVFRRLPAEDYATSWQRSWHPFRVGRLAVVARQDTHLRRATDRTLVLEPGGAFGTGRHPTTRACLKFLQGWELEGARVLDAGCGNGVLAVAAHLFGAREALGFDLDPHAIPYARALAAENGAAHACRFTAGGFEVLPRLGPPFDAVLANLYADLIEAHARELAAALVPAGRFAVSGCVSTSRERVESALAAAGLEVEAVRQRGRWLAFEGRRRTGRAC